MFAFKQTHFHEGARCGLLQTPHGTVETPNFIFCATKAAIKGLTMETMKGLGTQFVLSNTYHLHVNPGADFIQARGGLHKFMNWNGPLLTDSGGFQIFSLGHGSVAEEIKGKRQQKRNTTLLKITEEGAKFRSYYNGQYHMLTPEKSMEIQHKLGVDFAVVLDECTPYHVDKRYTERSMYRSHRWGVRSLNAYKALTHGNQKVYGIIQGGVYEDLRRIAAEFVNEQDFFGLAVGGSLGGTKAQMHDIVGTTMSYLRKDRPVHLLGIGGPHDIFAGIKHGIDTFDCVHPTRIARHGGALVKAKYNPNPQKRDHLNLMNSQYKEDDTPIMPGCACPTCVSYSKSYIHYLLKAREVLASQLILQHNVYFMNSLMQDIRQGIQKKNLDELEKEWLG